MNLPQRIVLALGLLGLLHSSMVPPILPPGGALAEHAGNEACRYHAFTLRAAPFSREYSTPRADLAALVGEYGMIGSATALLVLLLGLASRRTAEGGSRAP